MAWEGEYLRIEHILMMNQNHCVCSKKMVHGLVNFEFFQKKEESLSSHSLCSHRFPEIL